ncbi:MAG: sulfotransferase [Acidimicrobiia bacterium]|nr:sulfotransferase [Acidimicrobiia bacterium]
MSGRRGNFQDPVGLVRRMLASGDPAARSALSREALRYLLMPLDWVLGRWEQRRLARPQGPDLPIVLIVGSPRSGSTLLYQVLAAHLPVSYPSNLTALFERSPITATMRLGRWARRSGGYRSYYGNTRSLGAPNDAFSIWNRWLGEDRYSVPQQITPGIAGEMTSFFAAWGTAFPEPFLNKNNRNTAAIALLAEQLPGARFIVARREPLFVAQSLIEARETVQGDRSIGWGLAAGEEASDDSTADVAEQVARIEELIETQLAPVDSARVLEVAYGDLCYDPTGVVRQVGEWLALEPQRLEDLKPFQSTDEARLSPVEFERLQAEIRKRFQLPDDPTGQ